jgi:hypothetical protein
MQGKSQRLVELDFFRGLVLLVILVDHIGGSMVSRVTLHSLALNDAAEVFVFLGGFATATAYVSMSGRRSESAARARFFRRAFEIYRAFLVTAVLMLLTSFLLRPFFGSGPNLATTDLNAFISTPFTALADVLLLRRQPYLSSVLPMYAFFALAVPFVLPLARTKPFLLLGASIALWAAATPVAEYLPSVDDLLWDFNPAAWQLMFVIGVIACCHPVYQRVSSHRLGWLVSVAALAIVAGMAYYKLLVLPVPFDGDFKRNLAGARIINFLGVAWLAGDLARHGVVRQIAQRLPWVGAVGRDGLVCFVAGAVISLTVDSVLFTLTGGLIDVPLGLAADTLALALLLAIPHRQRVLDVIGLGAFKPVTSVAKRDGEGRVIR